MAEFQTVMSKRDRMCRSIDCFDCIIGIKATTLHMGCKEYIVDYPNESEHIIMEWAKGGQDGRISEGYERTKKVLCQT